MAVFSLTEQNELDDTVGVAGITPYHKSLLYLVSRALEQPGSEVPLLGMAKFQDRPLLPGSPALSDILREENGSVIVTHASCAVADALTDARHHGDFDDDKATMTAALLRILGQWDARGHEYVPNAALLGRSRGTSEAPDSRTGVHPTAPPPPPAAPKVDQVAAPETGRVIVARMTRDGWAVVPDEAMNEDKFQDRKKATRQRR